MSKARLAPMKEKQLAIPHLELQAAVLGCRMRSVILEETKCELKVVYLWTDSKIVINYIKNKTSFGVFIAHRMNEVHKNSTVNEWLYMSTKDNIIIIIIIIIISFILIRKRYFLSHIYRNRLFRNLKVSMQDDCR